jgi:hypothetical protein
MRVIVVVIGILVALAGTVWALQGVGMVLGSFMSNNPTWIWIGAATAVIGLGLAVFGFRSGASAKNT